MPDESTRHLVQESVESLRQKNGVLPEHARRIAREAGDIAQRTVDQREDRQAKGQGRRR